VLLVAATLIGSSFIRVTTADLGFDRSRLLEVRGPAVRQEDARVTMERLRALPGVVAVGSVENGSPPLVMAGFRGGGASGTPVRAAGAPLDKEPVEVEFRRVTSGYFGAINNPIVRGRVFDDGDVARETAIVIDERVATELFGDQDPIGADIVGPDRAGAGPFGRRTVVGVIRHVRLYGPEVDSRLQVYLPAMTGSGSTFMVRTSSAPASVIPAIQAAFAPGQLVGSGAPLEIRRIEDAFRNITAGRRFNAGLMSLFGLLGIIIGAAGVYGVMASLVAQQRRELGVRVALGATSASIIVGVLTQAGRYVAAGLLIGIPAAWWASRSIASLLFEVRPTDTGVYVVSIGVIIASGIIAAWIPARRAARVNPIVALRAD
jgi:hypothetical protein